MRIAITAPTGHIGHALTEILLEKGEDLVLLARHPEKLQDFAKRGATIKQGSLEDEGFLLEATRDADALFWLTPADYQSQDVRGYQDRLGEAAARAIRENNISRVVDLSSIGAQHGSGTGPVKGLHDVEEILADAAENITHLRAAYFFENYLIQMEGLKNGQIYLPVSDQRRIPMIATRDIAQVAADRLTDMGWSGRSVIELEGPQMLSFAEAAEQIGKGLGAEVKHIQVDDEQAQQSMTQMGLSDNFSQEMLELYHGIDSGQLSFEGQDNIHMNTEMTLEDFSRKVMKPAMQGA